MVHDSLDLLESTIIWLMAIDAHFILYQFEETHWIEARKTTFKHYIIL
jgi:hypothetical protein